MKVCALIAEFNPMHNGHKYLIDKIKELENPDYIVCIMSGNYTQAGNIAICDKFKRAQVATQNGIDLCIELPTFFATSSSEYFAKYAVKLIDKLNIVDNIFFGAECDNKDILEKIAKLKIDNKKKILNDVKIELKKGISYPNAMDIALSKYLTKEEINETQKPNNILALEYITTIIDEKINLDYNVIKRIGQKCNDDTYTENNSEFLSATAIRNCLYKKAQNVDLPNVMPKNMYDILKNSCIFNDDMFNLLKYKIISNINRLDTYLGVNEGIENKIIKSIDAKSYDEFIHKIKSKRYTMSNIKRMMLSILLDITKEDFKKITTNDLDYVHVLSMSKKGKDLLSLISKKSNIKVITSINDKVLNNLSDIDKMSINKDIYTSNIYSIISNDKINKDYTNKL